MHTFAVVVRVGFFLAVLSIGMRAAQPASWAGLDIGSPPPALAGSHSLDATRGEITLRSSGSGLAREVDAFYFLHDSLSGDGEVVARVSNLVGTKGDARAGVMLRASLAPDAAQISLSVTAAEGLRFHCRPKSGEPAEIEGVWHSGGAVWLKVSRVGDRFSAHVSDDGAHWLQIGPIYTLDLPGTLFGGLVKDAVNTATTSSAVFAFAAVTPTGGGVLPDGIEAVLVASPESLGSATTDATGDTYTLQTDAPELGRDLDDFLFLQKPLAGDGELIVRLSDLAFTQGGASAGIAFRTSLARDSGGLGVFVTARNGLVLAYRDQHGRPAAERLRLLNRVAPRWLKLVRRGMFLSAFESNDGAVWSSLGDPVAHLAVAPLRVGLVLASGRAGAVATARFDHVSWPASVAQPPTESDPVALAGLVAWRKPDGNGLACVDCHAPFGYDIAQFNFNRDDVRLATTPHLSQADADAIFDMLEVYRERYPVAGGLKDFRTFRPLQPAGGVIAGGENASPDARDFAFGKYLQTHFRLGRERIVTLAEARAAAQELIDVDVASVPIGIKFNLWSRSVLREGPVVGGEIAEWLPSAGLVPRPGFSDAWLALQNAYIHDPSDENLWAIYEVTDKWLDLDPHNFEPGVVHENWGHLAKSQYRANLLFSHDELRKSRGLPSLLAAEDGVRPFPQVRRILTAELTPFWSVGDSARSAQGLSFDVMTRRNRETVHNNTSRNSNLAEVNGWQIQDLRLTWFWMGWMFDNSLQFSGGGSTFSGEYFIASLWFGEADDPVLGKSDSSHGFRFHQIFFNAVHQFKLGFRPGAWRDDEGSPQHFEASKGYYLGYGSWRARRDPTEPGLEESASLYRRILSNHIRAALLIHADEARARGGVYFNENWTFEDIALWRRVLAWADPEWAQADEALFAELRASISTTLTAEDLADPDGDGRPALLASALGMPSAAQAAPRQALNVASTAPEPLPGSAFAERYGASDDGRLTITFFRARADLTYVVEASEDLANWRVLQTNPGLVGQEVTVADHADTPQAPRHFLRLRVIKALP